MRINPDTSPDLMSYAFEGLIHAVDFYRVDKGTKFMTFAYHSIRGYLQNAKNERCGNKRMGWVLRCLSKWKQDQYQEDKRDGLETFIEDKMRSARVSEQYVSASIDMAETENFSDCGYFDPAVDTSDPTVTVANKEIQKLAIANVPEGDRECVRLRYFDGLTLEEIGERVGLTRERVRQKIVRGLKKAREEFANQGIDAEDLL